jgi:hypothetical protein
MPDLKPIVIAVDFDGTCLTHDFPGLGEDIGSAPVLHRLVDHGHCLVLNTMRSDVELLAAVDWFVTNKIPLYGINRNPAQGWTTSPKVYAQLYIDDAALGCPLAFDPRLSDRPFVDWVRVEKWLEEAGYLTKTPR